MSFVNLAVEGVSDLPVARRLIAAIGLRTGAEVVGRGAARLDARIPELNRSGGSQNWLILRDLDRAECPAALVERLLAGRPPGRRVAVRVPVRAVESWLLADRQNFTDTFHVARRRLPADPDAVADPKRDLVNVCRHSTRAEIVRGMTPRAGSRAPVGPEYVVRMAAFTRSAWSPDEAAGSSESLRRALRALRRLVDQGLWT